MGATKQIFIFSDAYTDLLLGGPEEGAEKRRGRGRGRRDSRGGREGFFLDDGDDDDIEVGRESSTSDKKTQGVTRPLTTPPPHTQPLGVYVRIHRWILTCRQVHTSGGRPSTLASCTRTSTAVVVVSAPEKAVSSRKSCE